MHVVSLSEYPQFMQEVVAGQVDGYIKGVVKLLLANLFEVEGNEDQHRTIFFIRGFIR